MIKTLVCSFPPLDSSRPPLAGAIVANICKIQGHDVRTVDLQYQLTAWLKRNHCPANFFDDVFYEHTPSFDQSQLDLLKIFIKEQLDVLKVDDYDYIVCSLFSYLAQQFAREFLQMLRPNTKAKIIIGGAGLVHLGNFNIDPLKQNFAEEMKSLRFIDEFIVGEAEHALPMYFDQGSGPGIGNNNFKQIDQLDDCPWPDYSFYDLKHYGSGVENTELCIIGSRGCVRNCTFCDVAKTTPKYRYRSGKNIAQELIHHYETHGISNFYFTDSLVNGSYKAFEQMCEALANYKFANEIKWSGQYIIRSKETTPTDHFYMLKQSGCRNLFVGIESGSDRVRFELGKKFTNNDIEFYLENFAHFGIQVLFLFFSGYVTETEKDHAETLQMFKRWQRYVATGTIVGIETLNILTILPGTPLEEIARKNKFLFLHDQGSLSLRHWINPELPNFDFQARVLRHIEMIEEAIKYKWPLWNGKLSIDLYQKSVAKFVESPKQYIPISLTQS